MVRPPPAKFGGPGDRGSPPLPKGWPRGPAVPPLAPGAGKNIDSVLRASPGSGLYPPASPREIDPLGPGTAAALDAALEERGMGSSSGSFNSGALIRPPSGGVPSGRRPSRGRERSCGLDGADGPLSFSDGAAGLRLLSNLDDPTPSAALTPRRLKVRSDLPPLTARESRADAGGANDEKHARARSQSQGPRRRRENRGNTPRQETSHSAPSSAQSSSSRSHRSHHDRGSEPIRPSPQLGGVPKQQPAQEQRHQQHARHQPVDAWGVSTATNMSLREFSSWLEDGAPELAPGGTSMEPEQDLRGAKSSLLEEMERERMMWESKTIALCGASSRPSSANASAFAGSTTAPCTPGSAAASTGAVLASTSVAEPEQIHVDEAEKVQEGTGSGESVDIPKAEHGNDADAGPGLIAAALLAAGLDNCTIEATHCAGENDPLGAEVLPSTPSKWSSSAKTWAAERLRRKKDRTGLRSGETTPCGHAATTRMGPAGSGALRSGAGSPCNLDDSDDIT